jgi:hypothetical protein
MHPIAVRVWLLLALAGNAGLWLAYRHAGRALAAAERMPPGERLPRPTGRTLDGEEVTTGELDRPCHLLRYASASCGSCGRDQALFLEIERTLRARGCSSIQLAPSDRAFSHPVDPLRVNLAFPSVPFASGLAVTSTPTTIVTDRDWKVSWSRIGTLRRSDVDAAVRAASRLP